MAVAMSLFTILGLVVVSWAVLSMVGSERQRLLDGLPKEIEAGEAEAKETAAGAGALGSAAAVGSAAAGTNPRNSGLAPAKSAGNSGKKP